MHLLNTYSVPGTSEAAGDNYLISTMAFININFFEVLKINFRGRLFSVFQHLMLLIPTADPLKKEHGEITYHFTHQINVNQVADCIFNLPRSL